MREAGHAHRHSDEELHRGLLPSTSRPASSARPARASAPRGPESSRLAPSQWRPRRAAWAVGLGLLGLLCLSSLGARDGGPGLDYEALYRSLAPDGGQSGCRLPRPDPWDPSVLAHLSEPAPLLCKHVQPDLTLFNASCGLLSLNESAVAEAGLGSVRCAHQCFRLAPGQDFDLLYGQWVSWERQVSVECEFFHVSCSRASLPVSVHSNVYSQFVPSERMRKRAESAGVWEAGSSSPPSVLMLVIDSVSSSNAVRYLPGLLKLLKEELGAVLFQGYSKVGDNSFPNAVAMMTGRRACVQGLPDELPCDNKANHFDHWPFIWKDFQKAGYATALVEDYPAYNLFDYLGLGFRERPTDAYYRPFWLHAWATFLHRRSTHLCLGARRKLTAQLDYLAQFLEKSRGQPSFALGWPVEIGHDYLNQVRLGDDDFVAFFRRVQPLLANTVVVVMADHGHRFASIRETVVGRVEERLPLFALALPEAMRKAQPGLAQALRDNAQRLTSHYDLYVTLRDLLSGNFTREAGQGDWAGVAPRGLSLLRPVPRERSCHDAGVPADFCVCQQEAALNISESMVVELAERVLGRVAEILAPVEAQCAPLRLAGLRSAQTLLPNAAMVTGSRKSFLWGGARPQGLFLHYRVAFEASPSGAVLEGTVRADPVSGALSVLGDVNRINRYGNQSHCIRDFVQRKYCFCRDLLPPADPGP